jgi:F-type H+-transporting ATPase subunit b
MAELLKAVGFEPTKFIFTIVNFLIVFFILKKFLFGSIIQTLEERKVKISKGLDQAELAEKQLSLAKEEAEKIINEAKVHAEKMKKDFEELGKNIIAEAKKESAEMIAQSRQKIIDEQERNKKEMLAKVIDFVTISTKKVFSILNEAATEKQQRLLVEKVVSKTMEEVS